MSLVSAIWGQSQFDEIVDKATSELRLAEEDIALNLEICDQIRSKSVPPKDATRSLKRRLNHKNPNVQLLALGLTDVCVKNGGDHFLNEVASQEFIDNLVSILKIPNLNHDVKNKILRLIQNWSVAFEGKWSLGYVKHVYMGLKSEGFTFPPEDLTVAASAMVDTSTAPDWIDSDICLRCRTAFTFTNRKHHCRNCGQVFDQQCSSKSLPLPHFGISQEVRVCDGCFTKLNKSPRNKERSQSADFHSGHHRSGSSSRAHKHRSARDFADTELQRAIQLSLAESNGKASYDTSHSNRPSYNQWQSSEPPLVDQESRPSTYKYRRNEEDDDPELKAAIEASLREANAPKASAPVVTPYEEPEEYAYRGGSTYANDTARESAVPSQPPLPTIPNHDLHPRESDAILTFSQTVQDAHAQGGTNLSRIPNVNDLFDRANSLRPKLALSLDDAGRKEQMLSEMHDKLSQAVKLYDQLLTEQISRPTWRATSASPQTYGRTPPRHHTLDVSQRPEDWPRQQYIASPPPVEQGSRKVGYNSVNPPPVPIQSRPPVQPQLSQVSEYGATSGYAHSNQAPEPYHSLTTPTSGEPSHRESYSQQQQPWSQIVAREIPFSQPTSYQPTPSAQESWPQSQQYQTQHGAVMQGSQSQSQPSQSHASHQHIPTSPIQPQPPAIHHSPPPPAQQQYVPIAAAQPVQLPLPVQQPQFLHQPSAPSSSLSRHNTFSHPSYASPPQPSTPGRSNTVTSHSYSQPQNAYTPATAPSNPLPMFPTAPTSNPQMFPMYSPPVAGLEETEKKEVALIEL